jgi:hypothetical protein
MAQWHQPITLASDRVVNSRRLVRCCAMLRMRPLYAICCVVTTRRSVSTVRKYFTVLGTMADPWRKQSQVNVLTVVSLCLKLSGAHRGHRTSLATPVDRDLSCFMLNSVG